MVRIVIGNLFDGMLVYRIIDPNTRRYVKIETTERRATNDVCELDLFLFLLLILFVGEGKKQSIFLKFFIVLQDSQPCPYFSLPCLA